MSSSFPNKKLNRITEVEQGPVGDETVSQNNTDLCGEGSVRSDLAKGDPRTGQAAREGPSQITGQRDSVKDKSMTKAGTLDIL